MHANLSSKLSGGDYDLALALFMKTFSPIFEEFERGAIVGDFPGFSQLGLTLKAESTSEGVSLGGRYDYKTGVMNSDYSLRVAAKLDRIRESDFSDALDGVYGEFAEFSYRGLIFRLFQLRSRESI